jgi:hypothetical protein
MNRVEDQSPDRSDEAPLAVSLLVLGYAGLLVPILGWALTGLILMLLGALITVALWQRSALHHQKPSRATRLAVWVLKFSALSIVPGRALVAWLCS